MDKYQDISFIHNTEGNLPFRVLVIAPLLTERESDYQLIPFEISEESFSKVMASLDISITLDLEISRLCQLYNVENQYFTIEFDINKLSDFSPYSIITNEPNLAEIHDLIAQIRSALQQSHFHFYAKQFHCSQLKLSLFNQVEVKRAELECLLCELESVLSEILDTILHHPKWQKMESAWRGVAWLTQASSAEDNCQIDCISFNLEQLREDVCDSSTANDSDLYQLLYRDSLGQFGGIPYGCVLLDYAFSRNGTDIDFLKKISEVCALAHVPLISGASASLFGANQYQDITEHSNLTELFSSPLYIKWRSFSQSLSARYVCLTLPRIMIRRPYSQEVTTLDWYKEQVGENLESCLWTNAAFAFTHNLIKSFITHGFCSALVGLEGGEITLPLQTCPTSSLPVELVLSETKEAELVSLGFNPICSRYYSGQLLYQSANSVAWYHVSQSFENQTATTMAEAQLQYLFIVLRIIHCLKILTRENIGSFNTKLELNSFINNWLRQFVSDVALPTQAVQAQRPLKDASVTVREATDMNWYDVDIVLTPHFKFLNETVTLDAQLNISHKEL
ncbi:type VI secretion system contractile sheath large subunit [Pseudoalteromonas ulvae]|uniref:Type VI secretion protein n=1 Tax=Pseudoalteromonas ulvae TaxID=107327 RepID=A0A244CRE2_PSEDV|nr:type VI secretion system contractile sheath large subunit [Pseudoalteromonas ulvae]OUL58197.1 hypothetical protein B1199_07535 [Pseudoalteromonas ulvae]